MVHMSMATARTASATRGWPAPASMRRHQRCAPPPAPAVPARRTGRRSRCATGRRASRTPRSPHRSATGAGPGGAHQCPGAAPGRAAAPAPGQPRRRTRRGRTARRSRTRGPPQPGSGPAPRPHGRPARAAPGQPAPRRNLRHRSVNVLRLHCSWVHFHRCFTQHTPDWPRPRATSRGRVSTRSCGRHEHRPAVRAPGSAHMIGDYPQRRGAVRASLRIDDLQAVDAEQHRRRILEHDARGFLMILMSVGRPKIVRAAGSLTTAPRRNRPRSREPGTTGFICRPRSATPRLT